MFLTDSDQNWYEDYYEEQFNEIKKLIHGILEINTLNTNNCYKPELVRKYQKLVDELYQDILPKADQNCDRIFEELFSDKYD